MSAATTKGIDYFRFTNCKDRIFTATHPYKPNETVAFCFEDDSWHLLDILKPHEHNSCATISFSNVAPWLQYDVKQYVAHLWLRTGIDANMLQQLMVSIRHLGRILSGFTGTAIDLRANDAREFSRRFCELNLSGSSYQRTRRDLNRFIAFVRQQHPEDKENDFRVDFPLSKTFMPQHRPLEQSSEARIDAGRLAKIIDACTTDLQVYQDASDGYIDPSDDYAAYKAKSDRGCYLRRKHNSPHIDRGPTMPFLLGRAIKAQAVILAICVGRRAAAICNGSFNIRVKQVEWTNEVGHQEEGVMVRFRERKVRNVDEDVFCPGIFGELALQAIKTTKELTKKLRIKNPDLKEFLFIVPTKSISKAQVLRPQQINEYMNGQRGNGQGIRQRYNIPGPKVTTHNFRHTRATNMWVGGMQVHEVAYDLGHVSAEMTIRHYIVGKEESRRRLQFLMDHGAIRGVLEDFAGGRETLQARLGKRHVEIMKKQGRILTPTRYGYCALPASSGPCPTANRCYIGPGGAGEGCDHHILSPDALPALNEDKEVLETTINNSEGDPELRAWVQNHKNMLGIVNKNIERAETLQGLINECCNGDKDTCIGGSRIQ
jgi:site-specific recombinase XerD